MKTPVIKKWLAISFSLLLFILGMVACINFLVLLEGTDYERDVNAGDEIILNLRGEAQPALQDGDEFNTGVLGVLVPKSWKGAENITVTYTLEEDDAPITYSMSLLSENDLDPHHKIPWSESMYKVVRIGKNILDDMEWIPFRGDEPHLCVNQVLMHPNFTIKIKTGEEFVKVKISCVFTYQRNGLSEDAYYATFDSDCITVNGEGDLINFCEQQPNSVLPSNCTKDDLITFRFLSHLEENDLYDENEIYLCSTAITTIGNVYDKLNRDVDSLLILENPENDTYSLTCWPADYFDIPETESIQRIEYYFSNKTGDKVFNFMEDDGSTRSFNFSVNCK